VTLTAGDTLTDGTARTTSRELRPDAELVPATLGGDRAAFTALVARYERAALATAWGVLHDRHLSQDAAQEAFVSAFMNLCRLREHATFGAWLLTIARRAATRSAKCRRRQVADPLPQAHPVDAKARGSVDLEWVVAATAELPEHERVVIYLRYFEDLDVGDIAKVLARPVGTVTKQLSRAHERLRQHLQKEGLP
jgi:RNA polymerase sigma-70 factor (ECF subfamily)